MNFDKWFEEQSLVVKIILIILPIVGWVMEILIRISAYVRTKNNLDLALMIIYILLGWTWIPLIVDIVFLATKGHLFMSGDFEEVLDGAKENNGKETVDAQPKEEKKEDEPKQD